MLADHDVTASDLTTAAWLLYPSRRHLPLKTRAAIDVFKTRLRGADGPGATGERREAPA